MAIAVTPVGLLAQRGDHLVGPAACKSAGIAGDPMYDLDAFSAQMNPGGM